MKVKFSKDENIRALQERILAVGKTATTDRRQLELATDLKWEKKQDLKEEETFKNSVVLEFPDEDVFKLGVQVFAEESPQPSPDSQVDEPIPF